MVIVNLITSPRVTARGLACSYNLLRRSQDIGNGVTVLHISHKPQHQSRIWIYLQKANEMPIPMTYSPYGNILNLSRMSRIHFCAKSRPLHHWNKWKQKLPITPFSPLGTQTPSNTWMPKPTPLTTPNDSSIAQSVHALPHNYATKSPLVTMGYPKVTHKTAPSPFMITAPSNTLIPRLTPLTTQNGIRIHLAAENFPDRLTDRPTDRIDNRALTLAILIKSDMLMISPFDDFLLFLIDCH